MLAVAMVTHGAPAVECLSVVMLEKNFDRYFAVSDVEAQTLASFISVAKQCSITALLNWGQQVKLIVSALSWIKRLTASEGPIRLCTVYFKQAYFNSLNRNVSLLFEGMFEFPIKAGPLCFNARYVSVHWRTGRCSLLGVVSASLLPPS